MVAVMKYFDIPAAQFRREWGELSDLDKKQLKDGVADGTLTY